MHFLIKTGILRMRVIFRCWLSTKLLELYFVFVWMYVSAGYIPEMKVNKKSGIVKTNRVLG